ncbi:MAG: Lrp/AsnC family transcriptional regulator [Dehalococcoidales bacterium]|nr:Lrp/AsnC family transcriptional regulator [Dehalococcoidales bacterium]
MLKDILKILENDARATPRQIAAMTGMPQAEVVRLIKKAQQDRTIIKYKAIVNWDKAENEHVLAWIGVRLEPQKDVGFDSIAERIYRFPQAHSVYLVSGTYDLMVMVIGKNNHEIADFVSQKLSHIEGVKETVTQFILKRYKEDGETMEGAEVIKRQAMVL